MLPPYSVLAVKSFLVRVMLSPTPLTIYSTPAFSGIVVELAGIVYPLSSKITVIASFNVTVPAVNWALPSTSLCKLIGALAAP